MKKKKQIEIDVYVLCLHKFKDDKVVFTNEDLKTASKKIHKRLKNQRYVKNGSKKKKIEEWYVYSLDPKKLEKLGVTKADNITKAELGYYHHRTIVKVSLRLLECDFSSQREIRRKLKEAAENMIKTCIKDEINKLINTEEIKNTEGEVIYLYTYPFLVVKDNVKKSKNIPFSQETGTLSFDIYVRCCKFFYRRSLMRVSGPSTILYTRGDISDRLLRDIINAIYQHCLYAKKFKDEDEGIPENRLDESILVNLWTHIINTMGGRPVDTYLIWMTYIMYILAIIAISISLFALILAGK